MKIAELGILPIASEGVEALSNLIQAQRRKKDNEEDEPNRTIESSAESPAYKAAAVGDLESMGDAFKKMEEEKAKPKQETVKPKKSKPAPKPSFNKNTGKEEKASPLPLPPVPEMPKSAPAPETGTFNKNNVVPPMPKAFHSRVSSFLMKHKVPIGVGTGVAALGAGSAYLAHLEHKKQQEPKEQ